MIFRVPLKRGEPVRLARRYRRGMYSQYISCRCFTTPAPLSPQRTRNIMLAGALGLMLGVFAALFLEFYRSTTPSRPPVGE